MGKGQQIQIAGLFGLVVRHEWRDTWCTEKNISNTFRNQIHNLSTWRSPEYKIRNPNFIIIKKSFQQLSSMPANYPEVDCNSDHNLCTLKTGNKKEPQRKSCSSCSPTHQRSQQCLPIQQNNFKVPPNTTNCCDKTRTVNTRENNDIDRPRYSTKKGLDENRSRYKFTKTED